MVGAGTGLILGGTLLGPEAGEAITAVQTAVLGKMPYTAVRGMIINHPVITEGLIILLDALSRGRPSGTAGPRLLVQEAGHGR